jgi:class 3 adenylate cyclase
MESGPASRIEAGRRWLTTPPTPLSRRERRFFRVVSIGAPFGAAFHLSFVPLFWWLGAPDLAVYNGFATAVWVALLFLFRRRAYAIAIPLAAAELWAQAFLGVHAAGWQLGFQYFLFLGIGVAFLTPASRRWSLGLAVMHALVLLLLYVYAAWHVPVWAIPPALLRAAGAVNILIASGFVALVGFYYLDAVEAAEGELEREHARSEALLHNVLPATIADRLKRSTDIIADAFPEATILFADLVGFTALSASLPPDRLVEMLNHVFSRFDDLVRRHGVEKIKTIGDAYMAAAGIPVPRADHAEALAALALDIRQVVVDYNRESGMALSLRIGLHSGDVVAGVIGKTRFLYDLWGDTVNTASRMESHGLAGEIQLSDATAALLDGKFQVEERGVVDVKGKGPMRAFFLRGRLTTGARSE